MIKRTLSLVLCLIMVLGLATPAVQATGTDSVYSDDIMDNIVIEDGANVDLVVDGNSVSTSQDTKLPNPVDLVTEPTEPPYYEGTPVVDAPVVKDVCKCVDLASAVDHSGICKIKAPYIAKCDASAEELFAGWANFTLVEQDFLLKTLQEKFPLKYDEFMKLLSAPTGSASETYADGTTVSVEGIPQDGTLTVGKADAVKDIVDAYVAEKEEATTELFSYDVSVQDGEGADWQPETSVKMELELPGAKLHKNTKVFVVHVDDNGVATTIEAQVTEDGKIAFETPGFSAFYGFTVDFDFEGATFSINGMSSIKLSELIDKLSMPLNAEDVAGVQFTNDEYIRIEKQEGDWELFSLAPFTSTEALTLTMNDGQVYEITVTDAQYAKVLCNVPGYGMGHEDYNWDWDGSEYNGNITWNADTDGGGLDAWGWSRSTQVEVRGPGTMIINIQNNGGYTADTLYVDLYQLKITNGAQVTLRVGGQGWTSTNKRVCIRSSAHSWTSSVGYCMIWVDNGSLEIVGRDGGKNVDFVFGGKDNLYYSQKDTSTDVYAKWPLIMAGSGCTSLSVKYAEFMHAAAGAIGSYSSGNPSKLAMSLENCYFHKSVYNSNKGGAVRHYATGSTNNSFSAKNCTFNGNKSSSTRGGAVSIDSDIGAVSFTNCKFQNTTASSHGGAIAIGGDKKVAVSSLSFSGCTFSGCTAQDARGGAIRMDANCGPLTITNTKFSNCTAKSHGGAIALEGTVGNISITGTKTTSGTTTTYTSSFTGCTAQGARGGAIGASCTSYGSITMTKVLFENNTAGTLGGGAHFGMDGASTTITAGAVSVSGCDFKNNKAGGIGGGMCLTDGTYASVSVTSSTFDGCRSANFGGGIAIKCYAEDSKNKLPVKVTGDTIISACTFTNCTAGALSADGYQDTAKKIPVTWDHDGNPSTAEIDKLNGTGGGGAIALGGTYKYVEIVGSSNSSRMKIENCASWNNAGAILFNSDMVVTGKTESGVKKGVRLQYVNMRKCFARDSGNAVYFSNVQIDPFDMSDCTVEYCDSFDVARTTNTSAETTAGTANGNKAYFDALFTAQNMMGDACFGAPGALTATEQAAMVAKWQAYGKDALVKAFDAGGTLRTIGNAAVVANIKNCTFQYNGSFCNGGGVYWNANNVITDSSGNVTLNPKVDITNVTFTGNRAAVQGGGLYCEAAVKVLSCTFSKNDSNYGGAISQNMYNNSDRQLGSSGGTETNNLELGAAAGVTNSDGTPKVTKIYNNTANYGAGIAITVGGTNSYPHTIKSGVTGDAAKKIENWVFKTDFTYEMKFKLGGSHVYNNKANKHGGGIYYSATYYGNQPGNDKDNVPYTERQRQVDSFVKDIQIDDGLIYSNIAGYGATASNGGGNGGGIYMNSNQKNTAATIPTGQKTGSSTVSITGGSIYKNKATIGNGGGVYLQGTNALCTISGDSAVGAQLTKDANGKVVLSSDGRNTATGERTGKNLYTGGNGGGIAIFGGARIEMEGGYVYNNKATTAGGGIAVHGGSSMYLSDGYVDNNESSLGGGISLNAAAGNSSSKEDKTKYGFYFNGGNVRNNRIIPNGDSIAYGGGICIADSSTMLIANGEVSGNIASKDLNATTYTYAGGQEGGGIAVCQASEMTITGGTIDSNKAYDGGGIAIRGDSTVTMSGSITVGTDASGNKDMVLSSNGSITNNFAYKWGGGVYMANKTVNGNTFNLTNGYVANNSVSTSGSKGGGVFMGQGCVINLKGGRIEGNYAYDGGGILGDRAVMNITNGEIKDNEAGRNGGGIYNDYGTVNVNGGKIYENTCAQEGGGVFCYSNNSSHTAAMMTVTSGSIIDNTAGTTGGGIHFNGPNTKGNGTLKITGGTIQGNAATTDGGGLYVDTATFTMEQSGIIKLNTAGKNGGGAYLKSVTTTIKNGTLDGNTATTKKGGGIYCNAGTLNISGGTFKNNVAKADEAGGLCVYNATDVDISNGTFTNNAGMYGGGMLLYKCPDVNFTGGTFKKNYSNQGAGLFIRSCTVTIGNITVTENECKTDNRYGSSSSRYGGGMLIDSAHGPSTVTINNGTFNKNKAPHGAGMWITNNGSDVDRFITLTINGGTVQENVASGNGGGILINGSNLAAANKYTTLTMNGGIITKNTANSGNGGGICVMGQARAFIKTGTVNGTATVGKINENSAKNGGGVYVTGGGQLTVTNGYITYNKAITPASVTAITTCLGKDNSLYGTGGGICVTNGSSAEAKSTFILNSASGNNDMAIYGNLADFAADDVFASSNNTKLDVPEVQDMNLAGYGFKPEGWIEDYCTSDTSYTNAKGLKMLTVNDDGTTVPVLRYRNATATQRRHMVIITTKPGVTNPPNYVKGTNVPRGSAFVNMDNAYVCMTLGIPAAADDVVVVDYGYNVNINVYENDLFMNGGDDGDFIKTSDTVWGSHLYSSRPSSGVTLKDKVYFSAGLDKSNQYKGPAGNPDADGQIWRSYGKVVNSYNGEYVYNLTKLTMSQKDTFAYAVRHNDVWYYATVYVLPATTIYYEENTSGIYYHTNTSTTAASKSGVITNPDGEEEIVDKLAYWEFGGKVDKTPQDQDRPGFDSVADLDADNVYGYDGGYHSITDYQFSKGNYRYVKVYRDTTDPTITTNARATFTFTGTGFDIISMCNKKTGMVTVSVYKGSSGIVYDDNPYTEKWEPTTPLKSWIVDTWYQQGGTTHTSSSNLYQVPVIKCSGLPYDTYTVELYVAPSFLSSSTRYNEAYFYLDAIRIYDPAKDSTSTGIKETQSDGTEKTLTMGDIYAKDGEQFPTYQEVRNMLIEQRKLSDNPTSGAIYIDKNANPSLEDYKLEGPNNEVYLASGKSIAFTLNELAYSSKFTASTMGTAVENVHIGMRGLGAQGTVEISASGVTGKVTYNPTATDMYYEIPANMRNKVITISNTGSKPVALSTFKVTHNQAVPAGVSLISLMTVDNETARIALEMLSADQLSEPALTPKYPALSYNGLICYNVFFDAQDLGDLTEADLGLAIFSSADENGTVETAKDVIYGATKVEDLYMITSNGVHAKYLGDTQYFRVFAKNADGSLTYSKMVSYSAAQYARGVLAKSDDVKLKQLAVAMLNYGAEAQKFFGYKTDSLMNSFVTADNQALVADFSAASLKTVGKVDASKVGSFASTGGFTRRTPSISFKGAFEINYFFTPANAVDGDMTLYFWNEDTYNGVSELTAENADKAVVMDLVNGAYIASSDEIIAKKLDQTVYVAAVYESNGATYCSGVLPYSIAAYCQNPPAGVQDLAHAAAVYGCAAKEFFGV